MMVRITWKRIALTVLGLIGAALVVAWSGLVPIHASLRHGAAVDWFLHFTMQSSARTYGAFQTPDKVADDSGLVSAAGHFRQSCQACHGAPGIPPSPLMQAANPPAPDLTKTVAHYSDRELFWILQHGVAFTGMPAWVTQDRPDEVRRMVSFVSRLPNMTPKQYRALTQVDALDEVPGVSPGLVKTCAGCHGEDGLGFGQPDIPILAGQRPEYLLKSLRRYAAGRRASAPMQVAAAALSEDEMRLLARHYAGLSGLKDMALPADPALLQEGLPERQLPACASCHAPGKKAPIIIGQRATYQASRLESWRGEKTVIDAHKSNLPMPIVARRIPKDQIKSLTRALENAAD